MMRNIWWKIFEMGLAAGWLVLVVLALRLVCRRIMPHNIRCALWLLVALRLVCPVMPESVFSLMPGGAAYASDERIQGMESGFAKRDRKGERTVPATGQTATEEADPARYPAEAEKGNLQRPAVLGPEVRRELQPENATVSLGTHPGRFEQNFVAALAGWGRRYLPGWLWIVWLAGLMLVAGYGFYSYGYMRHLVQDAVPEPAGNGRGCIWRSDRIRSPFVLGFFNPRIYLPCGVAGEIQEYVAAHEQAHIRRRDPLVKLAGYFLLAVYWFQPLIWIAYGMLCRDIELACDERVIRGYGEDVHRRRGYMDVLLTLSTQGAIRESGILAFGERHVRRRIRNLLRYRRPAVWTVGISVLLCGVAAVCFLTDPRQENAPGENMSDRQDILEPDGTNLMALPMGQSVKADLDGDGEEEILRITVNIDNEMAQLNDGDWRFAKPVIQVDEQSYVPENFFDSMDLCTWYLFRIGGEAEGYQIGLYEDGPSADPATYLFAWRKAGETGRLVYLGYFRSNVIYDTYPGYCWERGGQEPVGNDGRSYREILEQADRSIGSWMCVPGDGSIYTRQYMDIVQSEQMVVQWKLRGIRYNGLEMQQQSRYEFWNADDPYDSEYAYGVEKEFYVYTEPDRQAETALIPAGENVVFLFYDAESGWIELGYSQGEKKGYILSGAPYSSILLAPGPEDGTEPISQTPRDIFTGLHMTD